MGFGEIIGAPLQVGVNAATTWFNKEQQEELNHANFQRQQLLNQQGYNLNELAAENADKRQRAQYKDLYSIEAIMKQMKENGLSPSMMLSGSMGGGMGQGSAGGAQGGSSGGAVPIQQAPQMSPIDIANVRLANAQARNLDKDTDKKDTEIGNIKADTQLKEASVKQIDTVIENLNQDTKLKEHQTELVKLQEGFQDIQNFIQNSTINTQIETINKTFATLEETLRHLKEQNAFDEGNYDLIRDTMKENKAVLVSQRLLNNSQRKLNEKQVDELNEQITNLIEYRNYYYEKNGLGYQKEKAGKELSEAQKKREEQFGNYLKEQMKYISKRFKLDIAHEVINDVVGIVNAGANVVGAMNGMPPNNQMNPIGFR